MKPPVLNLKHLEISPPLFSAPMAGVSHSAFRRLVADFGGYGALFTEMLSGRAVLHEKIGESPFTKKRPAEGLVWYQLALSGNEEIPRIIDRLRIASPAAIDLNAGCPAPEMTRTGTGIKLFEDTERFTRVLKTLRSCWDGVLTVKCRLWHSDKDWKQEFLKRLRIIEECGVDAVFVHPRFFGEKLRRIARWEFFEWICGQTSLPVIANGDIGSIQDMKRNAAVFSSVQGFMIGRLAVVQPWIFRDLSARLYGQENDVVPVDYRAVWKRYFEYVNEDFPPEKAIGRLKEFTKYYSCNFFFGQQLKSIAQGAPSLSVLYDKTVGFLSEHPRVVEKPSVSGI